ncbi:OmpA family protein [bacterium]|nr:OmpA family protein [bacterium]
MKKLWVVAILILAAGWVCADDFTGARPLGMGRTFVGVADDANAMEWNPAGIASFQYLCVLAGFNREFWGIDGDNLGTGYLAAANQYRNFFAYGISWRYFFSDVYSENHLKLALAKRFGWKNQGFLGKHPLSVGLAFRLMNNGYNSNNFVDNPDDPGGTPIGQDPVFADGTSKWGFSLDAGLLWKLTPKFILGISAANILQPNLSLVGADEGKTSMQLRFGASYSPNRDLLVALDGRYFTEGSPVISPHIGFEKWFYRHSIAFRGGYNMDFRDGASPDELTFGLGWRLNKEWALQVDYAFLYPLNKLSAAGVSSHKFSVMFQVPNPIPVWDLAAVSVTPQMQRLKAGDEVKIDAVFKNGSANKVKKVNYSAYVRKPDGTYALLTTGTIENIKSGAEKTVSFTFKDFQPGEYTIFAVIDDDGSAIPQVNGQIEELDEGNNTASAMVRIFPPPVPKITFDQDTLHITRLTFQETEEPVIPVIFFDPKSAEIKPRYQRILDKLALRITRNPDVVVKVSGYYDPETDGKDNVQIAQQREDAVYNYLLSKIGSDRQIKKDDSNDPAAKRAGGGKPFPGVEKYLPMIRAENRRVELTASIPSLTQSQVEQVIYFDEGQTNKQVDFSSRAMTYKSILERNPDVMLLLDGYATPNEGPNYLEPAFTRAANLKEQIKKVVPFYLWDRIFAWGADRETAEKPMVRISLISDGVIYKPFEGRRIPKGETVENPNNFVRMSVTSDNAISSHRAELLDLSGNKVKTFSVGDGEPPAGLPWDWKDDGGQYIQAGKYYVGHISVTDELGAAGEAYSETLVVDQVDKVLGIETMLIVIFKFDKDEAISPYYHSRMEAVAKRLIELAEHEPGALTVAVTGHTDIIGLHRRNMELSQQRAKREYRNLRVYLRHLLNLPDDAALDKWLAERQVKIVTEGYGPERPYTLKKMREDGTIEEKLLGDNKLPEGREINRRVLVEFRSSLKEENK